MEEFITRSMLPFLEEEELYISLSKFFKKLHFAKIALLTKFTQQHKSIKLICIVPAELNHGEVYQNLGPKTGNIYILALHVRLFD